MDDFFSCLQSAEIIPVLQIKNAEDAEPVAGALISGGINAAEVTFRTDAAEESIRRIANKYNKMLVLAGTVVSVRQAKAAVKAGAKGIVSPGYDDEIVSWCIKNRVPVIPGVSTASEVQHAVKQGLCVLKFFPAESCGGVNFLNAIKGPFASCSFMPTGGLTEENFLQYAKLKNVIAVSGSWVCPKESIQKKDWEEITALCKKSKEALLSLKN